MIHLLSYRTGKWKKWFLAAKFIISGSRLQLILFFFYSNSESSRRCSERLVTKPVVEIGWRVKGGLSQTRALTQKCSSRTGCRCCCIHLQRTLRPCRSLSLSRAYPPHRWLSIVEFKLLPYAHSAARAPIHSPVFDRPTRRNATRRDLFHARPNAGTRARSSYEEMLQIFD